MKKIIGIGVDLVKNRRIQTIVEGRTKDRFLQKVLHQKEIDEFNEKKDLNTQVQYLASRWAFKEAIVKASGKRELIFPFMYLEKSKSGQPAVALVDKNKELLQELGVNTIQVSLSHEEDYSVAFVMLGSNE